MDDVRSARSFSPDAKVLTEIRRFVGAEIERHSFRSFKDDLLLAVTEACSNAIRHSGTNEIRVEIFPTGACLRITVSDDGVYRPLVPAPELDGEGHRGIHLMTAVVDDFSLHQGTAAHPGTTVSLVKCKT
jgi:anti-sigma regulatory factor (Ser/Thr protein kinase)